MNAHSGSENFSRKKLLSMGWVIASVGALVLSGPVWGVTVRHLFRVEFPVPTLSASIHPSEIHHAAHELLARLTGDPDFTDQGVIGQLLTQSTPWVAEYGYVEAPSRVIEKTHGRDHYLLWVRFDPRVVEAAIFGAHLPFWGALRPLTLAWLSVGSPTNAILSATDTDHLRKKLEERIRHLSLPILLPLMDLSERVQVPVAKLIPPDWTTLERVSRRYGAEAIWTGILLGSARGGWQGEFAIRVGGLTSSWQSREIHRRRWTVLASALGHLDTLLAARYAVFAEHRPVSLVIQAQNVASLTAVARIERFLATLPGVSTVRIRTVASRSLTVTLRSRISRSHLVRLITLGDVLTRPRTAPDVAVSGEKLDFSYRPSAG
ncbi:MAG: DUF2066 domain-containing protein [Gammaproteobacteria bacterium]